MDEAISRQVLDLWNRYRPTIAVDAIEYDRELKKLLGTNLAEVGTDCSEFPNNSDAISRQAAIDAITFECGEWTGLAKEICKQIEQLPPIQPEIVRCKDCKYARLTNDGSCKYCDIWFPDEAEYMDGDYYCASAERKSNG